MVNRNGLENRDLRGPVGSNPSLSAIMNTELKPWYVYIIECNDGTLYTGISNNVDKRLEKHTFDLGAKYTRKKGPFKLVYIEKYIDRSQASKREYQIKQLTREQKLKLVKG